MNDMPKFDLQTELDRIDRRRAKLYEEMDRADSHAKYYWLWFLAPLLPIAVGVWIAIKL